MARPGLTPRVRQTMALAVLSAAVVLAGPMTASAYGVGGSPGGGGSSAGGASGALGCWQARGMQVYYPGVPGDPSSHGFNQPQQQYTWMYPGGASPGSEYIGMRYVKGPPGSIYPTGAEFSDPSSTGTSDFNTWSLPASIVTTGPAPDRPNGGGLIYSWWPISTVTGQVDGFNVVTGQPLPLGLVQATYSGAASPDSNITFAPTPPPPFGYYSGGWNGYSWACYQPFATGGGPPGPGPSTGCPIEVPNAPVTGPLGYGNLTVTSQSGTKFLVYVPVKAMAQNQPFLDPSYQALNTANCGVGWSYVTMFRVNHGTAQVEDPDPSLGGAPNPHLPTPMASTGDFLWKWTSTTAPPANEWIWIDNATNPPSTAPSNFKSFCIAHAIACIEIPNRNGAPEWTSGGTAGAYEWTSGGTVAAYIDTHIYTKVQGSVTGGTVNNGFILSAIEYWAPQCSAKTVIAGQYPIALNGASPVAMSNATTTAASNNSDFSWPAASGNNWLCSGNIVWQEAYQEHGQNQPPLQHPVLQIEPVGIV